MTCSTSYDDASMSTLVAGVVLHPRRTVNRMGVFETDDKATGVGPELVVLRVVGSTLLDHPFGPEAPWPVWAAGLERDDNAPDGAGWRRTLWPAAHGGRGWLVPVVHVGDVIEFGSWPAPAWRWFGWYTHHAEGSGAIVVTGPFASPGDALADGQQARDELADRVLADYRHHRLTLAAGDVDTAPGP